jgi:hypothetical protein
MSELVLPTLTDGTQRYDFRVRLDEVDYLFDFLWNKRRACWVFSITGLDGARILTGQTVVVGLPLLRRAIGGPPGQLIAFSSPIDNYDLPGLTELGGRVRISYFTADDPLLAGS